MAWCGIRKDGDQVVDCCIVHAQIADGALAIPPTAFGALGALGIIGAALFVADPEKRCAPGMQLSSPASDCCGACSFTPLRSSGQRPAA